MTGMETRTIMRPVRVQRGCDCMIGRFEFTGETLLCMPPLYVHACTKCGKILRSHDQYPRIEYEVDPNAKE